MVGRMATGVAAVLALCAMARPTLAMAQADLVVVLDPAPAPGGIHASEENRLGLKVLNLGSRSTPRDRCVTVSFRTSSPDIFFTRADGLPGTPCPGESDRGSDRRCSLGPESTAGWCNLDPIPAGGFVRFGLYMRPETVGGNSLTVVVDPDNRIREANDRNNTLASPIVVVRLR